MDKKDEVLVQEDNLYGRLLNALKEQNFKFDPVYTKNILDYAEGIYKDSKRYKGETTLSHAVNVAIIVAKFQIGIEPVYASILHELPKFNEYNPEEVLGKFGTDVGNLVKDSSKLYLLNYGGQADVEAEKLRKMFMAIAKDIRVVIMKLADRLYNMRNIYEESIEFQKLKATETLHVYAPIADRLGMSEVKSELEDISFSILNPVEYEKIRKALELGKEERKEYIHFRIEQIKKLLEKENIKATIYGRAKFYYSIYKKTKKMNCKPEELFDLYAIRVIVNSVKDCYSVLGIIHQNFKPMPGRFKDYIAVPKTNMYQSLHTTLFGEERAPFEVQIRTWDMHNVAEYGVAAHFLYKEGATSMTKSDEMLNWIRKTLEMEQQIGDTSFEDIKVELFGDEVFVFTPKGEIKSFPKGASTIDFAYSIHQDIAEKMVGAKINGKIVPITTKLKNTDVVEVITSKASNGPKLDWIKSVKTSSAKCKIVSFLKKKSKEENISKGLEAVSKELAKSGISLDELLSLKYVSKALEKFKFKTIEDLYENVGFGVLTVKKAANKILDEYYTQNDLKDKIKEEKIHIFETKGTSSDGVIVKGIDNCLVKFAKCCSPIPGDEIIGYISYGKGVSIHRKDCPNLAGIDVENRKIEVNWRLKDNVQYETKILVLANDRDNLGMDILKVLNEINVKVTGFLARVLKNNQCEVSVNVQITSADEIFKITKALRKVDSVYDVRRAK